MQYKAQASFVEWIKEKDTKAQTLHLSVKHQLTEETKNVFFISLNMALELVWGQIA